MKESDAETQYHDQVKLETKHDCLYYAVLWEWVKNEEIKSRIKISNAKWLLKTQKKSPAFAMLTILLYNLLFLYRFQRASNKRRLTMKYSRRNCCMLSNLIIQMRSDWFRIPTMKLKIPGKAFLKSESRTKQVRYHKKIVKNIKKCFSW